MRRHRAPTAAVPGLALALALALALGVAACSGDGGDSVTSRTAAPTVTSPPSEIVPYCEATVALDVVLYDAINQIGRTAPEALVPTVQGYGRTLQPLAQEAIATAPADVRADVEAFAGAIDAMAVSGDVTGLNTPPASDAQVRINDYTSQRCGWPTIEVVTNGGPLGGVPQRLGPGLHVFVVRNDAARPVQVDLYERVAAETESPISSLLVGDVAAAPVGVVLSASALVAPGAQARMLVNLEMGEYGFVLARPEATVGAARSFVPGTVSAIDVVETG